MRSALARINRTNYGVLGNHDTIHMVPELEAMGIRMLLNECEAIERGGQSIYLAQYREGRICHSPACILDPATPHTRNLSTGGPCRFRSLAERPHPWRPNLSAGVDSPHTRLGAAPPFRRRSMAISQDGGLHRGALDHQSLRCVLTACRKSLYITYGARKQAKINKARHGIIVLLCHCPTAGR